MDRALDQVELLSRCNTAERRTLLRSGEVVSAPAGRVLQRPGDPCNWVYFVLDGCVFVRRRGCPPATHGAGSVVGLREAFDDAKPAMEVTTMSDALVFVVERRRLENLLMGHPGFALGLIRALARHA